MTRRVVGMLGALPCLWIGCGPAGDPPLVIASAWPPPARDELIAAYRRARGSSPPVAWVALAPGDRPADALARRGGVDVVLGGPPRAFAAMAEAGLLEGPWALLDRPGTTDAIPEDPGRPPAEFADPRDDPATLDLVASSLRRGDWAACYADLIRRAAHARPAIGRGARGRSALGGPGPGSTPGRVEGVGLARGGRNRAEAGRFLEFLEQSRSARPSEIHAPLVEGLIADLVGATLVDAHDELEAASVALQRGGHPPGAEVPFVEAPPWPPASVAKLRADPDNAALLDTLAEQVAPDPDVRGWLLESWAQPPRPIDGALLKELAGAVVGRLAREPRFRAWLRVEWTAWARQRYRRVARVAGGWVPS